MTGTTFDERREQLRAELTERSIYDLVGGEAGIRAIVDRFYDLMDGDERFAPVRRMHATDLGPMRVGLYEFLSGWLGGPQLYVQRQGSPCITAAHAPFVIDERARDLWVACMQQAMDDTGLAERYREALMPALGQIAEMLRNR